MTHTDLILIMQILAGILGLLVAYCAHSPLGIGLSKNAGIILAALQESDARSIYLAATQSTASAHTACGVAMSLLAGLAKRAGFPLTEDESARIVNYLVDNWPRLQSMFESRGGK